MSGVREAKDGGSTPGRKQVLDQSGEGAKPAPGRVGHGCFTQRRGSVEKGESGEGSVEHGLQCRGEEFGFFVFLPEVSGRDFEQTGSLFLFQSFRSKLAGGSKKSNQIKPKQGVRVCVVTAVFELCKQCCEGLGDSLG